MNVSSKLWRLESNSLGKFVISLPSGATRLVDEWNEQFITMCSESAFDHYCESLFHNTQFVSHGGFFRV